MNRNLLWECYYHGAKPENNKILYKAQEDLKMARSKKEVLDPSIAPLIIDNLTKTVDDINNGIIIEKLTKSLKEGCKNLTKEEAGNLVYMYYCVQDSRMRAGHQIEALMRNNLEKLQIQLPDISISLSDEDLPTDVIKIFESLKPNKDDFKKLKKTNPDLALVLEPNPFLFHTFKNLVNVEDQVRATLDVFSSEIAIGIWCKSITGIGPVISAGLAAYIDITKAPTAGSIWRYAGMDPTVVWDRGEKRPWNARLKVLCFKAGECFIKVSNKPTDLYGHLYKEKKKWYEEQNQLGAYREVALEKAKTVSKKTKTAYSFYSQGLLPPGHIHARARRFAVKMFLSHYHEAMYELYYGKPYETTPYPIGILGHAHKIPRPNEDILQELIKRRDSFYVK